MEALIDLFFYSDQQKQQLFPDDENLEFLWQY